MRKLRTIETAVVWQWMIRDEGVIVGKESYVLCKQCQLTLDKHWTIEDPSISEELLFSPWAMWIYGM